MLSELSDVPDLHAAADKNFNDESLPLKNSPNPIRVR
jgi:hypothetical protein